jgi:hypothetical protein
MDFDDVTERLRSWEGSVVTVLVGSSPRASTGAVCFFSGPIEPAAGGMALIDPPTGRRCQFRVGQRAHFVLLEGSFVSAHYEPDLDALLVEDEQVQINISRRSAAELNARPPTPAFP